MATSATSPFKFSFGPDAFARYFPQNDSMGALARGAMEASTASTRASVKGMQEAGQSLMAHMKAQISLSVETGKKLAEAESVQDAMKIQSSYLKSAFENNLKGFNELSNLYSETVRDTFGPITQHVKKAAQDTKTSG